uniref:RNA-directed DNA polymerase, eukaryota n=1 Tax=Tanacetum cinerariifolium TaxID=118510 RepID=A0A699GK56_TANCI|nr:RNA-directed DNA polymerase, eukaryota [Tanacetum cinerariifolium]
MGHRFQNSLQSKFDQTSKVSNTRDLWKACKVYGTVVDVFIPNKKSMSGKKFAFVRFIKADFVSRERTVWVDIEGVPIYAWSRATFEKIGSKWGDVMEIEESKDDLFARKRICIKTKQEDNIFEKFKIIVKGRIFVIRAKELFMWSPAFKVDNESKSFSDEESSKDADEVLGGEIKNATLDIESDGEAVSDTYFGENNDNSDKEQSQNQPQNDEAASLDLFNIYPLLNKKHVGSSNIDSDNSIPFPPGFSPAEDYPKVDDRVLKDNNSGFNGNVLKKRGSILEVLDGMVKVRQVMGYDMGGCMNDMEKIIGSQRARDVIQ